MELSVDSDLCLTRRLFTAFGTMEVEIENVTETALGCMKSHHSDLGNEMDQGYVLLKARTEQETKSKEKKLEVIFEK